MARRVYKYIMPLPGHTLRIGIPSGYSPVHMDMQGDDICMWAEVDSAGSFEYNFVTLPTGADIPQGAEHRGTVIDGFYVWHVYEI